MSPMPDATGYLASHATKFGRGAGARGRVRSGWLGLSQTSRKATRTVHVRVENSTSIG